MVNFKKKYLASPKSIANKKHCIVSEIKNTLVFAIRKTFPHTSNQKIKCQEAQKLSSKTLSRNIKKATIESGQMPGKRQKAQRRNRKKAYLLRSPCFVVEMLIY